MHEKLKNKYVLFALVAAVFFSFIVLNSSFRATLVRRGAIRDTQNELEKIEKEIVRVKNQLTLLETQSHTQEDLVRRELGYIKPGEKEIRFVQSHPKKK